MSEFEFKKFKIELTNEVFKFGTDAALLGALSPLNSGQNILEIGTGSGVISLMLAQRNSNCSIQGIDINPKAIELAEKNLQSFPLPNNISFQLNSIQNFKSTNKFDLIVSNPPFFQNSTPSPSSLSNQAKHTASLSLQDVVMHSKRLLSETGTIALIYPFRYFDDLEFIATSNALHINELILFNGQKGKEINRMIVFLSPKKETLKKMLLTVRGDYNGYSKEVLEILKPFLLKL